MGSPHAPDDVASIAEDKLLRIICLTTAAIVLIAAGGMAFADGSGDPAPVKSENGKYLDKEGNPTYKIQADGTVDWYTYSGYRRYNSECGSSWYCANNCSQCSPLGGYSCAGEKCSLPQVLKVETFTGGRA